MNALLQLRLHELHALWARCTTDDERRFVRLLIDRRVRLIGAYAGACV